MRSFSLMILVALMLTGIGGGLFTISDQHVFAQDEIIPRWEPLDDCFMELPEEIDATCGYVTVPESYTGESERALELGIVQLNATGEDPQNPLFMLMGGPGQSINPFLQVIPMLINGERSSSEAVPTFTRILENHDIIFMTQRGTEYSDTVLSCPGLASLTYAAYEQGLDQEAEEALAIETLQACIDGFVADGVDFNAYNNEFNAADVNAVRVALGYDQIIYYGESYGAQLGQYVMRDYPDILEAVVLDGANSLSKTSWAQDRAASYQAALDNIVALCAERPTCAEAYGDLNDVIDAAIAQFDDGPVNYTYQDPENADVTLEVEITLEDVAGFINEYFSFVGNFGMPYLLWEISQGNLASVGSLKAQAILASQGATSDHPILMQAAMICSDDPVLAISEAEDDSANALANAFARQEASADQLLCSVLNVDQLPDSSDVDVTLDVPTLLLGGALDTRTPPVRNQEVADHLPNSRLIVFPVGSHVQVPNVPCANEILADFVDDPSTLETLDTGCVATLTEAFEFAIP